VPATGREPPRPSRRSEGGFVAESSDIPEGSVADRVLRADRRPREALRRARERLEDPAAPEAGGPAALIFDRDRSTRTTGVAAVLCALLSHAGLLLVASAFIGDGPPRDTTGPPRSPMQVRRVELDRESPDPPEPKPREPKSEPKPQPKPEPAPKPEPNPKPEPKPDSDTTPRETGSQSAGDNEKSPREPSPEADSPSDSAEPDTNEPSKSDPAAEAGEVVDSTSNSEVADFTDFEMRSGNADSFAGGVTASSGTSEEATRSAGGTGGRGEDGEGGETGAGTRPVGLDQNDWDCDWPEQARELSIDEQVVVLRAVVRPDGTPKSVSIVSEPGFGFGEAARRCAKSHTFRPALDDDGEPVTATSPPIRVRFTR